MTIPIPARFDDEEVVALDRLVAAGVGANRSEVIRRGVRFLDDAVRRQQIGAAIAESYRRLPQSADEDAWAMSNAIALTEAEPW